MQKYLEILLELLRPESNDLMEEEKQKLLAAGKKIEEKGNKKLKNYHKNGFILNAYDDLLKGKISLDEFLTTGDITNNKKIIIRDQNSISVIHSIINGTIKSEDDSLFILDSISFWILSKQEKETVQNRAKKHSCELVFC